MKKVFDANVILNTKKVSKEIWLQKRKCGIGGSDAASVVDLNPFKSKINLYLQKVSKDLILDESSFKMEISNKLESFVSREFTLKTGKKVRKVNAMLRNDKYPFAIANIGKRVLGERAILECRVTNSFMKKEWEKQVPINYEIQCQHYLAVTGADCCYVAVLIGNEDLIIHKIDKDEEFIDYIMKEEENFWKDYVTKGKAPSPDGSEDYAKFLKDKYKSKMDDSLILFEKEDKLNRYDEILNLSKKLDAEKKTIEQHIQSDMGNYEIGFIGKRKVTWKFQFRERFDTKKFKVDYPDIAKNYLVSSSTRVFRVGS